jgi:SAM-dependent methyltransferase
MPDDGPSTPHDWDGELAAAWDRHRDFLFEGQRPVSDWLVDQLDPQPGQTVLELTAGPGETGFLVAERVGPSGCVLSTDLGPDMVDVARRGAGARGLTNVEFRVMDAQEIDLPDESVDGVLSRFGIMLLPEPDRALAGARRVLRDNGRLVYAVWGAPDRNPWLTSLAMATIQNGHAPPGDPFGPGGPFSLPSPDANRDLLTTAGFTELRIDDIEDRFRYDDFDTYWKVQSEVSGPIAILLASLTPAEVEQIRSTLEPMLAPYRSGDALEIPYHVIGVSAKR